MRVEKGKPSGVNRSEETGVPSKIDPKKLKKDDELTRAYTDDDKSLSKSVHLRHQNRNTNKLRPTNAGGYKNR